MDIERKWPQVKQECRSLFCLSVTAVKDLAELLNCLLLAALSFIMN
jgi:hypothetical protein